MLRAVDYRRSCPIRHPGRIDRAIVSGRRKSMDRSLAVTALCAIALLSPARVSAQVPARFRAQPDCSVPTRTRVDASVEARAASDASAAVRTHANAGERTSSFADASISMRAQADGDYETGRKAAQAELVKKLEGLADWCNSKELFQERDRVWRTILVIDTNNAAARKGLRYAHNPDGSWQEPAAREAKNRNPKALEELPAKRAAATETFRDAMLALVAKEPETSPLRRSAYDEILSIDPDDTVVHGLRAEKLLDGKWVLGETVRAKNRRAEIKTFAQTALATGATVTKLEPSELELGLGVTWKTAIKTDSVRVLSTGEEDEAKRAAALVNAVGPFFRSVFACDTPYRDDWTAYLLAHAGEENAFLDHFPGLSSEFRAFLKNVVGSGIPGQPRIVYWDKDPARRIDGCTRQTINDFLGRTFGLNMNNGWVWEGFGLYLTREITGSRYTWFIQLNKNGKYNSLRAKLISPTSNWMNEGLTLLNASDHPKFTALLDNDVNKMGIEDMLYAYVFAAYMIESQPEETTEFLHEIGQVRQSMTQAIQNVLHMNPDELELRLQRWLTERK
jgi:hypothetical protein